VEANQQNIKTRLSQEVVTCSLNKDELHRLVQLLQERANTAAEHEVAKFEQRQQTDEEYAANIQTLSESFSLRVTVVGANGQELYGTIDEVFNSPNFPEQVKSFYVNSDAILKAAHNYYPRNSFEVFLDFSKPEVFDFSFLPSQRTPNESNFIVQGYEATWANGVFNEIRNFIKEKSAPLYFIHKHSIYDILLWILGFPFAFWVAYRCSGWIDVELKDLSVFVRNALYIYVAVAALVIFRIIFHYMRWIFPILEYRASTNKAIAHRALLAALGIGIFGSFLYDLIKLIFQ